MASGRITTNIVGHCLAVLGASLLVSCSSGTPDAVDGVLVFEELVPLVRGEKIDVAKRELAVDRDATFVAMVDEDDYAIKIEMSHAGTTGVAPAAVKIDSIMESEAIEIAVLDAPKGSRLTLSLESPQGFDRPGAVRVKVLRYDAERRTESRVAARLEALRVWSAATTAEITDDELHKAAFRRFDDAMAYFESPAGDPALGAWARMMRSKFNYRQFFDLKASVADAEIAERAFAASGESRNAARARFRQAAALIEIAHDKSAKDPGPEEAAQRAKRLMIEISHEPSMSALERAYALNYLGVLAFHVYDLVEANARFTEAIKAFEAVGHHAERLRVLGNLGAIAIEEGDIRAATHYYDLVIADLDRFESTNTRVILLHNAARIDSYSGNFDRAIERYLRALELSRTNKLQANEARLLQGLGYAYWGRGDNAQATALSEEALKLRRGLDDAYGMSDSLSGVGALAREAGNIPKALALHREAVSFAKSTELRVLAHLDLAVDYQAASDYPKAIAAAREALGVPVGIPNFYRRFDVQLALSDMLLAQPHRTSGDLREATTLTQESLEAAIFRGDTAREIAARRLLALAHEARGELREARDEYEKAITLIFKYQGAVNSPELRTGTLAHEQKTFRGYVDLLMRDVARRGPNKLLQATASEEEALRTLEWARARNFDSHRNPRLDAASQVRLDDLLAKMAGKHVRITSLLESTPDSKKEIEALQLDIARLRAEADHLRANAAQGVAAAESPLGAPAWPATRAGVTQISYAIETQHAYVWVRDASGLRVSMLAASPAVIARELENLARAVRSRTPELLDATLSRLSSVLLPTGTVAADTATLEIVAEGQIAKVPFAALTDRSTPAERLSQRRSIVMIGSLFESHASSQISQAYKWGFVAIANDSRSRAEISDTRVFPALPTTNAEARSIAAMFQKLDSPQPVKLLLGKEGDARTVKAIWQEGIDSIHFATHGLADLRQPLASLLLLPAPDSAGNPSYLTAGQVQEWRGSANLVYLSACETAVGPARFADGLPGLQRAFLRAGARGVIATLWPVEDVYASQFASDFYRRYTAGIPAAQALSETQRAWMQPAADTRASETFPRRMTAWAHAFFTQ